MAFNKSEVDYKEKDIVECIYSDDVKLKVGEKYIVSEFRNILGYDYVVVKNLLFEDIGDGAYFPFRFKKVEIPEEEIPEENDLSGVPGFDKNIGESLSDFEVGQYVAVTEERFADTNIFSDRFGQVKEKDITLGTVRIDLPRKSKAYSMPKIPGFNPWNLLTAKGMEETLYKCSYCGKDGHNRRTCSELLMKGSKVKVESSISVGDIVTISGVKPALKAQEKIESYSRYIGNSFEVKRVDESFDESFVVTKSMNTEGKEFGFDGELCFSKKVWEFSLSGEKEEIKKMHIWELTETILPHSRLLLLYGPPGTGKTTAANFAKDSHGNLPVKVCNITLTEETPAAELRGHFVPKGGEFVWMDGPALTAFTKGYRLVLNEIDKASGDALTFCHALLDDPGIARLTLPYDDGEGEPEDLPEALRDRFSVRLHIDKVHPQAVLALPEDLHKIARKGISGDTSRSVSVRGWKAFATLRDMVGEQNAALAVFGDRAEVILNTIKISRSGEAKKD